MQMTGRADRMTKDTPGAHTRIFALFSSTLFVSAFLLFWIQPLFGKMVLPLLGGAPNVWITAMLFFQMALLAGYGYAHLVARLSSVQLQTALHLAFLCIGLVSLPIAVSHAEPAQHWPVFWLIGLATLSIGWPFVAISATAPLVQKWFAAAPHANADDPYFLYAASNLGSIAALLAYPVLLEPLLRLGEQSEGWTAGYVLLIVLIVACGFIALKTSCTTEKPPSRAGAHTFDPVTWRQRLHWVALAFAPSSLLLGVTTQITTDVASAPLLWIIPLILYLLTFIVAFSRRPVLRHRWMIRVQPYFLVLFPLLMVSRNLWLIFAANILIFFVTALVCHGELVRRRPT